MPKTPKHLLTWDNSHLLYRLNNRLLVSYATFKPLDSGIKAYDFGYLQFVSLTYTPKPEPGKLRPNLDL